MWESTKKELIDQVRALKLELEERDLTLINITADYYHLKRNQDLGLPNLK